MNFKTRRILAQAILATMCLTTSCFYPFKKEQKSWPSIYDKDKFLEIDQYSFEDYRWNAQSKRQNELYLTALADFFYKKDYSRAAKLLYEAHLIYAKDARQYVRLAECYARMNNKQKAEEALIQGNTELPGLFNHPGVRRYYEEITGRLVTGEKKPPGGVVGILTWVPRKIWGGLKKLWIF